MTGKQSGTADHHLMVSHTRENAETGQGPEVPTSRWSEAARGCPFNHRTGQKVFRAALGCGRRLQHLVTETVAKRVDRCQTELPLGERAGLVEHDGVDRGHRLEVNAAFEE